MLASDPASILNQIYHPEEIPNPIQPQAIPL